MDLIIETLTGDSFELKVNESDTILSIKNRIQKRDGIPVTNQFLVWNDQELSDFRSITDYEIRSGSKLKLILKLIGGPMSSSYGLSKLSSLDFINKRLESLLSFDTTSNDTEDDEEEDLEEEESDFFDSTNSTSSTLKTDEEAVKSDCESKTAQDLKKILQRSKSKRTKITLLIIQCENDIKLLTLPIRSLDTIFSSSSKNSQSDTEKLESSSDIDSSTSNESNSDDTDDHQKASKFQYSKRAFTKVPSLSSSSTLQAQTMALDSPMHNSEEDKTLKIYNKILSHMPKANSFRPSESSILYEKSTDTSSNNGTTHEDMSNFDYFDSPVHSPLKNFESSLNSTSTSPLEAHTSTQLSDNHTLPSNTSTAVRSQSSSTIWNPICNTSRVRYRDHEIHASSESFFSNNYHQSSLKSSSTLDEHKRVKIKNLIMNISQNLDRVKINNIPRMDLLNQSYREENSKLVGEKKEEIKTESNAFSDYKLMQTDAPISLNTFNSLYDSSDNFSPNLSVVQADELKEEIEKSKNRCTFCNKKMGLIGGFVCSCGNIYCNLHRYAETHDCQFDYKSEGRRLLNNANPLIVSSKVRKI